MQHKGPTVFTDIAPIEGPACSSPTEKARLSASRVGVKGARKVDGTAFRARKAGATGQAQGILVAALGMLAAYLGRGKVKRAR
jgi:hypothetical protein